jgi:hypothetical protein
MERESIHLFSASHSDDQISSADIELNPDSITARKNKPGTHSITISFFSKFFDANQGKVEESCI